jgi:hypothetical protein
LKNFTREVRAPVDLVIEAVREETKEWRESVIPPELRKLGVARMKGNVQPPFFRFWLAKPSGSDDTPMTLRAVVIPTPDGGARLRGGIGRRLDSRFALVFPLVGLVALAWGAGGVVSAAFVSAIGMVAALLALVRRGALATSDAPEADYLMQRLAPRPGRRGGEGRARTDGDARRAAPLARRAPEISRAHSVEARVSPPRGSRSADVDRPRLALMPPPGKSAQADCVPS